MRIDLLHIWNVVVFSGLCCLILFIAFITSIAPVYTLVFLMLPVFALIALIKFRLAVLCILFITAGFIPKQLTPSFYVAGGELRLEDCILGLLFIICLIRVAFRNNRFINNSIYYPFYFLFSLIILGTILAFGLRNKLLFILIELRIFFYWIYPFILAISIQNKNDLNYALKFVVILSVIVSAAVIIQGITGVQLRNYGTEIETLETLGKHSHGIIRSRFGGNIVIANFSFVYILARVGKKEISLQVGLLILTLIGFAIIISFGRGAWMGSFVSILALSIWLGRSSFIRIWTIIMILCTIGILTTLTIKPEFFDVIIDRALSVGEEIDRGGSFMWRKMENAHAIQTIQNNPIFGVGIGGEFKRPDKSGYIMGKSETHYLHNSWYFFMIKFGIIGILFPIWLTIAVFHKTRKLNTSLSIASASALLMPIVVGATQMDWINPRGILCITTIIGLLAAHANLERA